METTYLNKNLEQLALENQQRYSDNKPFPHIVLDGIFKAGILENIQQSFSKIDSQGWNYKKVDENEIKMASNIESHWPENIKTFLRYLNSQEFVSFVSTISGINNLIPDPDYIGGGLHQIKKGGLLKIHADFNKHPKTKLDRRINVLIYLNKNWKEEWNGQLELWDSSMQKCVQKILPEFNRVVIFSTTSNSFHGHPTTLKSPEEINRRSIALYYYTNGRPEEEMNESHSTLFKKTGIQEKDHVDYKIKFKKILSLFIPPIFSAIRYKMKKNKK
ncbi:MAG: 2OG-Fe(II) oxygenase [Bacteroidia bacterium]